MKAVPGKVYEKTFSNIEAFKKTNVRELLSEGYLYVKIDGPIDNNSVKLPLNILSRDIQPVQHFELGDTANFLLLRGKDIKYIVLNGFLIDIKNIKDYQGYGRVE